MRALLIGLLVGLAAFAGAFLGSDREALLHRVLGEAESETAAAPAPADPAPAEDQNPASAPVAVPADTSVPTPETGGFEVPEGKVLVDVDDIGAQAFISNSRLGGSMPVGTFKAQGGVAAATVVPAPFRCDVAGFELIYYPKRQDPIPSQNAGARYNERSRGLIERARPGDLYVFDNVRVKCPGWTATRQANSMAFRIR